MRHLVLSVLEAKGVKFTDLGVELIKKTAPLETRTINRDPVLDRALTVRKPHPNIPEITAGTVQGSVALALATHAASARTNARPR
jgi:hypothetical protein